MSDAEPARAALYELLQALGYAGAADALYVASGVMTIPRSRRDTRDGREEAVREVQSAFENEGVGIILISDSTPLDEAVLTARGAPAPTALQAYA